MPVHRLVGTLGLCLALASNAAAQDQTIVVDQPLQLCGTSKEFPLSSFDERKAEAVVKAALGIKDVDRTTYYVIHATEFVDRRMIVAAEHWYVFYKPWTEPSAFWWFRDSRQFKHFKETRVFGSSRVGIVYLYTNVPTYSSRDSLEDVAKFFLAQRIKTQTEADVKKDAELAAADPKMTPTDRQNAVRAARKKSLDDTLDRFKDRVPRDVEDDAAADAKARLAAGKETDAKALEDVNANEDLYPVVALETELYFKALSKQSTSAELPIVNKDTGETLTGLSPTLATTDTFKTLVNLYYKIEVTKKLPAPVQNLKDVAKLAFGGESGVADRLPVQVQASAVCAGRQIDVEHIPSDMMVKSLVGAEGAAAPTERSHQLFDNEGRYWWDVSLALPLDLRRDLSIDVDGGQVAAKSVEKADLFAVVNLGMPRDTKKIQWQLIPNFVYGIPITGKPLKHHLVGFTIGLNYVQLLGGVRFDRRQVIATANENGTPVGIEATPPGEKWEHEWVWGINLPVQTVVKAFKK